MVMLSRQFFTIILAVFIFSCNTDKGGMQHLVNNAKELESALENAQTGDEIILANGIWNDVVIEFKGEGTAQKPIVLRAETPGKVFIEGESCILFGGDYLTVSGLHFRNGHTPEDAVVLFKLGKQVANHCTFTKSVIEHFNQPQRDRADHWVEFWGRHNELSYCNLIGKSNSGPTVRIQLKGNESVKNYHRIVFNHFGPRPRKGGPHGETIQLGDSGTSMCPGNTLVANNLFDRCNGEVEVISSKSNFNEFRNNVFFKCEGSLVTRHGNYCIIDGNYFIGDENSTSMGGIRIINTGHWVTNNYFYHINGNQFRSALAVMNGIPKSPLNRYNQVTDVVVAYNTWVDCRSPWQFGVGANLEQRDVLPASEIRSARPTRTLVANNVVYTFDAGNAPIVAYDEIDGVLFKSNVINQKELAYQVQNTFDYGAFSLKKITENIYVPSEEVADVETFPGFEFDKITSDILGNSREGNNQIGAFAHSAARDPDILNPEKYGCDWFSVSNEKPAPTIVKIETGEKDWAAKIKSAKEGTIFELAAGTYSLDQTIDFITEITLRAAEGAEVKIVFTGEKDTPLFRANPFGNLTVENISFEGNGNNTLFSTLQKNMSALYQLKVSGCKIIKFGQVLKAYKETFADSISFVGCNISDCANGIVLAAEINDKGDYNTEFLTVENCRFEKVKADVINYYRGGYDESTIGGNLLVKNCEFTRCGAGEKSGILLKHRGIINVTITGNTFEKNRVKRVAILWGAKNNTQSGNTLRNSGEFEVQKNIKLNLMY